MIKAYLGGPRVGQTLTIGNIQFVNGVAEIPKQSVYLERYYAVQYEPPAGLIEEQHGLQEETKEEVKEEVIDSEKEPTPEDQAFLNQVVAEKKRELEVPPEEPLPQSREEQIEHFNSLRTWGEKRSYVRSVTGTAPRDKAQALQFLGVE